MKSGIYKITNLKGKIYIGQSIDIESRFKNYHNNPSSYRNQTKLLRSFAKYGIDSHIFEAIEYCEIEKLNERERFWQDYFKVLGENGLNLLLTNSLSQSGYLSEETKLRIKNTLKGKTYEELYGSKEEALKQKEKRRQKAFQQWENTSNEDKDRTKEKIRESVKLYYRQNKIIREIVECPHCGKKGGISAMHRWHFNNCTKK